jgi:hypothetical protein
MLALAREEAPVERRGDVSAIHASSIWMFVSLSLDCDFADLVTRVAIFRIPPRVILKANSTQN